MTNAFRARECGAAVRPADWLLFCGRSATLFASGSAFTGNGVVLAEYLLSGAKQDSILSWSGTTDREIEQSFPIATRLRILPSHACATGA